MFFPGKLFPEGVLWEVFSYRFFLEVFPRGYICNMGVPLW